MVCIQQRLDNFDLEGVAKALLLARNEHEEIYYAICFCVMGIHPNNLIKLTWGNIDLNDLLVILNDKTNRNKIISLSKELLCKMKEDHSLRKIEDTDLIFRAKSGTEVKVVKLHSRLKRFLIQNQLAPFTLMDLYYVSKRVASSKFNNKSNNKLTMLYLNREPRDEEVLSSFKNYFSEYDRGGYHLIRFLY